MNRFTFTASVFAIIAMTSPAGASDPAAPVPTAPEPTAISVPKDASVPLEAYASAGAPAHDRPWAGSDMARMADTLRKMTWEAPERLPRFESEHSGAIFDRLCSVENLEVYRNRKLPIDSRLPAAIEYYESISDILMQYVRGYQHGAVGGRDLIELVGHVLRSTVVLIDLVNETLPQLDPNDPTYAARMEGLKQMKGGLATMTSGILMTYEEHHAYTIDDLSRLTRFANETFPHILPELSAAARAETIRELKRLATEPALSLIAGDLNDLASELETTIAVVEE